MAAALLSSPCVGYSPPTSPESSSGSSSNQSFSNLILPPMDSSPYGSSTGPSLSRRVSGKAQSSTPTRTSEIYATPAWVGDELEEEWVEQDDAEEETPSKPPPPPLSSSDHSRPRVPSSLRHAFSTSHDQVPASTNFSTRNTKVGNASTITTTTSSSVEPLSSSSASSSLTTSTASNGTFVQRDTGSFTPSNSRGKEDQLQAAVRAMRGPASGLGAGRVGEVEVRDDKLGGLMRLFRPPSPPALPPSIIPAPSAPHFTFSPPLIPERTSWKKMPHFSPSDSNSTPLARNYNPRVTLQTPAAQGGEEDAATPTNFGKRVVPTLPVKARYLRSTNINNPATAPLIEPESSAQTPPAPTSHSSSQHSNSSSKSFPTTPAPHHSDCSLPTPVPELRLFEFQYDTFTQDHLAALVDEIDELSSVSRGGGGEGTKFSSARRQQRREDEMWETSFVDVPLPLEERPEEEDRDSEEGGRSTKRIRLSPPSAYLARAVRERNGRESFEERRSAYGSRVSGGSARRRMRGTPRVVVRSSAKENEDGHTLKVKTEIIVKTSTATREKPGTTTHESGSIATPFRDRLGEANALLDRIRARTAAKSDRIQEVSPESSPSISRAQEGEQYYPDEIELEDEYEEDVDEERVVEPEFSARQKGPLARIRTIDPSPRKLLRRLSASDEVDEELRIGQAEEDTVYRPNESTPPTTILPSLAAAASASLRNALGEQSRAGRTAAEGLSKEIGRRHFDKTPISTSRSSRTALPVDHLVNSAPIATPSHHAIASPNTVLKTLRHPSLTTIGPNDMEALLASAAASIPSRMVFDKLSNRWIKASRPSTKRDNAELATRSFSEEENEEFDRSESTEDDPFKDFDDTRGSEQIVGIDAGGLSGLGISAGTPGTPAVYIAAPSPLDTNYFESSPVETVGIVEEEEVEQDWGKASEYHRSELAQSEDEDQVNFVEETPYHLYASALEAEVETEDLLVEDLTEIHLPTSSSLVVSSSTSSIVTPRPLRQPSISPVIPRSALKPTVRSKSDPGILTTPAASKILEEKGPPRSVSFSDGKTSGKIVGVERSGSRLRHEMNALEQASVESENGDEEVGESEGEEFGFDMASLRTQRIEAALRDMEELDSTTIVTVSPNNSLVLSPLHSRKSCSVSESRTYKRTTDADNTFLTECSFGVSADRLVHLITDVEPFEPNWEGLGYINLAGKGVESLVRLKEFLPRLDHADFAHNEIAFLTGIPSTIRTLLMSSNKISSLTSFAHLRNLERLDLSDNKLASVDQLTALRHLRELKIDNNEIRDIDGLAGIDGLVRLSVRGNLIEHIDFKTTKWSRLETLNLSRNRLASLSNLGKLQSLTILNLDHNDISGLELTIPMPSLRVLRASQNPLTLLDIALASNLRTLFVDGGRLASVSGTEKLRKLENLSIREQKGGGITLPMREIRDVKRLYLSGNPIPAAFPSEKFFNLVYLELAMCQLVTLPEHFAGLVPNLRALNLNFNFLEDLTPLTGLSRLNKLTVVGARLSKCRTISNVLRSMPELHSLDLRLNPCTLAFYPPMFVQTPDNVVASHSEYQILHPDDDDPSTTPLSSQWTAVDRKFRKALPDTWYYKRMTYRAVLLESAKSLMQLDGVECVKERLKLRKVLPELVRKNAEAGIRK